MDKRRSRHLSPSPPTTSTPTLSNHMAHYMTIQSCCPNCCGVLIPFTANGTHTGDGKKIVKFNVTGSTTCGIPVSRVLRGDLEGLIERDEMAELNPPVNSVRLKIEVSSPSYHPSPPPPPPLTCVGSCLATSNLRERSVSAPESA